MVSDADLRAATSTAANGVASGPHVLLVDQRDLSPEVYEVRYRKRDGLMYRTLCWLERRSARIADRVITVNQTFANLMNARGDLPPGKVTLVGNGPILGDMRRLPARP